MNFTVVNLGCKVNRVESDAIAAALFAAGGKESTAELANLIVINTCTVTGEAEKKTRKAVHRALRANDYARVVVTGCAVAIDKAGFQAMDVRVEAAQKDKLLADLAAQAQRAVPALRVGEAFPTRVGVKIQDGCNHACTYCIVHVARGRAWSLPAEEVLQEVITYTRAGVREIVLSGINLGSYHSEGMSLATLLKRLLAETSDTNAESNRRLTLLPEQRNLTTEPPLYQTNHPRFRISSIEPIDVDNDLIEVLATSEGRVCRHLHLPLQSGSSKVLQEMARPYNAKQFIDLVKRLQTEVPSIALSTDIIVGFPGETDEDFAATLEVVRNCGFSKIHVFPYSKREGTPAASRIDQVPDNVKIQRARQLRDLSTQLRDDCRRARLGTTELALIEKNGRGTTESYFEIDAPQNTNPGDLIPVVLA